MIPDNEDFPEGVHSLTAAEETGHVVQVTGQVNSKDVHHVELRAYGNSGDSTVIDHNGRSYPTVKGPDGKDYPAEYVLFGGVTNREAVSMVTAEELAAELLKRVWPDWTPDNDHSRDTPRRFVASLKELCAQDPDWKFTTFPAESDEMVTLGPIPFYTLCAHHVVPFYGQAWVGYIPDQLLCGLSKLARTVKHCAKGMHVQESLTAKIHTFLEVALDPKGVAVVLKAEHMCMSMRGIQVAGAITTTAKMSGVFMDHDKTAKLEFLHWIGDNK